jgi:hypothetical protein
MFFYILGWCRPNFMVLNDKMAVGHQKKDRNPYCICLVLNVPKHPHHQNILQGGKYGCPSFFLNIKTSTGLQVTTKDVNGHFGQRFGHCKESSCTCETLGS